jgi:hypothetical protein
MEANDRAFGATSILSYVPLELATLLDKDGKPVAAPARVQVRLVAVDTKGQEGAGPWASIDVIQADELERAFAGRRAAIKSELEGVRKEVQTVRDLAAAVGSASSDAAIDADRQTPARRPVPAGQGGRGMRTARSGRSPRCSIAPVYARMGAQA